jgi:AcrR family transcriptional regulator
LASQAIPAGEGRLQKRRRSAKAEDIRTRRYDPAETRTRVLEAAYMLFGTRGYAATGTADIAREADVSEGSIFYHFGSKQALLAELGRLHGTKLVAAMQGDDPIDRLTFDVTINRCFDFCEINNIWDEVVEDCGDDSAAQGVHKHHPDAAPFFSAARAVVMDWTRRHLESVAAKPGMPKVDCEIAASLIFALVGDGLQAYFRPGATDEEKRRIRAEVVRFCTAAAGTPACPDSFF